MTTRSKARLSIRGYVDGHYRREQRKGQRGESKAEHAASPAEHHALGQQLPNQPPAPGAERGAHSHFARAIHRAREHQIRDVRARDQQHKPDGGEENIHPAANRPAEQLLKRNRAHAARGIVVRKLAAQTRPHAFEISGRLCQRDIRADSPDRLQVLTAAARIRQVALVAQNGPELCALVEVGRQQGFERRGHDADNLEALIVHPDRPANDGRIGIESTTPQTVTQDQHAVAVRVIVFPTEVAAERRTNAKHRKEVPAHPHRIQPFRLGRHERRLPRADRRQVLASASAIANVRKRLKADIGRQAVAAGVADEHQSIGIGERQRSKECRVCHREDGRVRANPQGDGGHRGQSESWRAEQRTQGVAHILQNRFEPGQRSLVAVRLGDLRRAAQLQPRLAVSGSGIEALPLERLLQHRLMEAQLVAEILVAATRARHEGDGAERELTQAAHAPSGPRTRPMTSTVRRHSCASRASCRRPARVRL